MGLSVLATHLMIQLNDGWKQQSTAKGGKQKVPFSVSSSAASGSKAAFAGVSSASWPRF